MNSRQRISELRRLGHQLLKDWTETTEIDTGWAADGHVCHGTTARTNARYIAPRSPPAVRRRLALGAAFLLRRLRHSRVSGKRDCCTVGSTLLLRTFAIRDSRRISMSMKARSSKLLVGLAVAAWLTGCATLHKPGVTQDEANKDQYECERDVLDSHARGFMQSAMYRDCMRARGYT